MKAIVMLWNPEKMAYEEDANTYAFDNAQDAIDYKYSLNKVLEIIHHVNFFTFLPKYYKIIFIKDK